jgi:hypothetical protein
LLLADASDQIEQKHQQIIRMAHGRRQCRQMNQFKINQPHAIGRRVMDHVGHSRVTMRPRPSEIMAESLMRPKQFPRRRLEDRRREFPRMPVFPKTFPRQLQIDHLAAADGKGAETIPLKTLIVVHAKRFDFPALPPLQIAPVTEGNSRQPEVEIGQQNNRLGPSAPAFDHPSPAKPAASANRIDSRGLVGQWGELHFKGSANPMPLTAPVDLVARVADPERSSASVRRQRPRLQSHMNWL